MRGRGCAPLLERPEHLTRPDDHSWVNPELPLSAYCEVRFVAHVTDGSRSEYCLGLFNNAPRTRHHCSSP
ncbi:hypothetical protein C884_00290 [Kocuria palustris PEL]|uniref:Uncharacterized protein n=1 Tax=Kocuria palustris PEL TaxID=1236550 RepID=M2XC25_9MICC|nr:hypothetical protein C884_00290 [Kocuria palustris PEL]